MTPDFDTLSSTDLAMFADLGIGPELLARARVRRVTDREARERGFRASPRRPARSELAALHQKVDRLRKDLKLRPHLGLGRSLAQRGRSRRHRQQRRNNSRTGESAAARQAGVSSMTTTSTTTTNAARKRTA